MSLFLRDKTTCGCGATYYTEQEKKHLKNKSHQTYLNILETNTDLIGKFLENNCDIAPEFKQHRADIFNSYKIFLRDKNEQDRQRMV